MERLDQIARRPGHPTQDLVGWRPPRLHLQVNPLQQTDRHQDRTGVVAPEHQRRAARRIEFAQEFGETGWAHAHAHRARLEGCGSSRRDHRRHLGKSCLDGGTLGGGHAAPDEQHIAEDVDAAQDADRLVVKGDDQNAAALYGAEGAGPIIVRLGCGKGRQEFASLRDFEFPLDFCDVIKKYLSVSRLAVLRARAINLAQWNVLPS